MKIVKTFYGDTSHQLTNEINLYVRGADIEDYTVNSVIQIKN
jgi:hypothetical protein